MARFPELDQHVGKELKVGSFTATIMPDNEVMVKADKGFMVIYPSGFNVTMHLAACIIENDADTLNAIIALHYNILCTTPDVAFYADLLAACNGWVERNARKDAEDDAAMLAEDAVVAEALDELKKYE